METIRNKKTTGGLRVNFSKFGFCHIYAFPITFKAVRISKLLFIVAGMVADLYILTQIVRRSLRSSTCNLINKQEAGLTSVEANLRLSKFGKNDVKSKKKTSLISLLISQFKSPIMMLVGANSFMRI